jgi:hypothetical protein
VRRRSQGEDPALRSPPAADRTRTFWAPRTNGIRHAPVPAAITSEPGRQLNLEHSLRNVGGQHVDRPPRPRCSPVDLPQPGCSLMPRDAIVPVLHRRAGGARKSLFAWPRM